MDYYAADPHLRDVVDLIRSGHFSRGDTDLFKPLMDNLLYHDPYMLFADFAAYVECQAKVSEAYRDTDRWTRMSILNTARSGRFSSDRTIREYCEDIWRVRAGADSDTHAQSSRKRIVRRSGSAAPHSS